MAKIVNVVVSRDTTPIQEANFSIPCLFTGDIPVDTGFLKSTSRSYTGDDEGLASVGEDWGTGSNTYKAISALLGQSLKVTEFRIFRRGDVIAKEKTITFSTTIATGQTINGTVNGTALTATVYATSHASTLEAVATKIEAIEGIASATVLGNVITVVASDEWDLSLTSFAVSGGSAVTVTIATTEAGFTQANDIANANTENKDWYVMLSTSADKGAILTSAEAIQGLTKIAFFNSSESGIKTNTTGNLLAKLKANSYDRTALLFTHNTDEFSACAWAGRHLPLKPGKVAFVNKTLVGVTVDDIMISIHINNILNNNGNVYIEELGKNLVREGKMVNGDFIDIIRDLDYMQSQLTLRLFDLITSDDKFGFTDENIGRADSVMRTFFNEAYQDGIINNNYTTTPPKASSIPVNVRANRHLPDIPFTFQLQGAIQTMEISGVASV
jgi:hypothetical protein